MFASSFAETERTKPVTADELKNWEQRRRAQAAEIEGRRRAERRSAKNKKYPAGYGSDGRVPAYAEAHISSLEASPLAKPVYSPGRGLVRTPELSPSPDRRRRWAKDSSSIVEHQAMKEHRTEVQNLRRPRPMTADGSYSTSMLHQNQKGSAPWPPSRVRPATAPSAPGRSRHASLDVGQRRGLFSSSKEQARLMEMLASLSGCHQDREFPTVAAFRRAVAIEAVQAQLRECREKTAAHGAATRRPMSAATPSGIHEKVETTLENAARRRRRSRGRSRRRGIDPWDNRSPFMHRQSSPSGATKHSERPTSAQALRLLTSSNPIFGNVEACGRRRSSCLLSSDPVSQTVPTGEEPATVSGCDRETEPSRDAVSCAPPAARNATEEDVAGADMREDMQACFDRLTIGALIELSHLPNPPRPVQAVLAALVCLLGWQWKASRDSPPRSLLSNAYVLRGIMASIRPHRMSRRQLSALERRLDIQEATPERVKGANAAAAVLLDWLLAVVACARTGADHHDDVRGAEQR